ncbi:hypothetical protein BG011_000053 [Mortierella polycephala]|uniref:Peptide hydrolase n=1 Tax=Mortierella polycephala TaxID=41804 RepID=A0A9P6QGY5_9FUNG|nr:hypothetical protein BG011_000053 [Mortierella polycephala]
MAEHQDDSDNQYRRYDDEPSEESPLLQGSESTAWKNGARPATSIINQGSWRRMSGILLMMVISYLVIGGIVSYKRLSLPSPKSVVDARGPNDFSAEWAWQHLEQIAQRPHPINSRENLRIRNYLIQAVKDLQNEAHYVNRTVELADDHVKLTLTKNFLSATSRLEFYESSNVLVRVVGTEGRAEGSSTGRPEAVVVDAHFDSVLIGHGATDDGIGVSVCLEMIRNLIHHPVKHNVVFNINNGEEIGLYGAASFMKHPWAKDIKAFINLEGAGAGGRALLFRASNKALAGHYSKVGNSPHANVFGNDIFKLGLIKSGTDFSVYTAYNIPGLDIAFYSRRAFYHSLQDDIEHTSKGSVQHMGNTGLIALRNIADSDYLIKPKSIISSEASIYYDVAGLFMLVYSFNTYLTLNYNLLIVAPVFIAWAIFSAKRHGLTVAVVLRSYLAMVLSFVAAAVTSVAFVAFLNKVNPMLVYGEHWLAFIFFVFLCCTTIICVQWAWVKLELWLKGDMGPLELTLERIRVDTEQVANVGMVLFWWTLLIGATVLGRTREIGLFYFISWFVATSMISAYLSIYPKRRGTPWTLARLWINFLPLMMVLDIAITNMIAMSQTLVDGTPSFAIMALFALCALNCVMPLIPTIHRSANFKKMGQVSVFFTLALLISACIVFPYSAEEAPNKLVWRQIYDLDQDASLVTVKTMNRLEKIMDMIPEAKTRECGPDPVSNNALTQCIYKGADPKLVTESKKSGKEIIKSSVSKPEYHHETAGEVESESKTLVRTVHLKWTATDSRLCSVQFSPNSTLVHLKLAGFDEPDQDYKSEVAEAIRLGMVGFKREYDQIWDLEVAYKVEDKHAPALEGILGCLYDEWDQGEIPAFTNMKDHLPKWALLGGGKGPGLLTIQKKILV